MSIGGHHRYAVKDTKMHSNFKQHPSSAGILMPGTGCQRADGDGTERLDFIRNHFYTEHVGKGFERAVLSAGFSTNNSEAINR